MGTVSNYTQDDMDDYFEKLRKEDMNRTPEKRESKGTQENRVSALKFYSKRCLGLKLDFKDYINKGAR